MEGVIREVAFANSISDEGVEGWVGRNFIETVGDGASDHVMRMMAEARTRGVSDFRQVSQRFPSGRERAMEYNAVRLSARAGLIVIGKHLPAVAGVQSSLIATQQAREQDAWKLRAVETRFRALLDPSDEHPVLLLRVGDLHIVDVNPPAIQAGALDAGRDFTAAIAPADRPAFQDMIARVLDHGRAPGILLHVGAAAAPWLVRGSLTGQPDTVVLIQLAPVAALHHAVADAVSLGQMIERLPDGFVLIDAGGMVRHANRAFLDLAQCAAPAAVVGQPIGRWLSHPGADADVLIASVLRHRTVRGFATRLIGDLGSETAIEISAVGDRDLSPEQLALLLRDISRRPAERDHRPGNRADDRADDSGGQPAAGLPADQADADERLLAAMTSLTAQIGQRRCSNSFAKPAA